MELLFQLNLAVDPQLYAVVAASFLAALVLRKRAI